MTWILAALSRGLAFWVILGAAAAYLWPQGFAWLGWPLRHLLFGFPWDSVPAPASGPFDLSRQPFFNWLFAGTMLAVGTVIEPGSFVILLRRPLAVLLGLLTQFSVMPALAWLCVRLGSFERDIALGMILVGCAPGAMTSNVLTFLARGDTAFSVTLTTLASMLAVFVTPLLVLALAGTDLGMSAETFWLQLWTISWTVALPLLMGVGLRLLLPRRGAFFVAVSPAVASLAIVAICCFVIQWTRSVLGQATVRTLVAVVAINALGFAAGYLLARLYRFSRERRITLAIEIGMQNAGMGVVLAATTFADRKAVAIPSALFAIWCILTAAAATAFLSRRPSARPVA